MEINVQGLERIKKSLEFGITPIEQYRNLNGVNETISDFDFCELLKLISSKPEGIEVAVEILYMRLYRHTNKNALSEIIISTGQELLLKYPFSKKENRIDRIDHELASIIKTCFFTGESSRTRAKILCNRLIEAYANHHVYSMNCHQIMEALATIQPIAFLDAFLGDDFKYNHQINHIFLKDIKNHSNPMCHIDDDIIINWCDKNPNTRYPLVASAIIPFQKSVKENLLEWTPLAVKLISNSSDPILVLNEFKSTFRPVVWEGPRSVVMQRRMCLISELKKHENSLVADWARMEEKIFEEEIRIERDWELKRENNRNECFE